MIRVLRNRRDVLRMAVAGTAWAMGLPVALAEDQANIMTVAGPRRLEEIGLMLPHEHVLVDFVGADQVSPQRYDADEAFRAILPHLERVRTLGCRTLAECTPAYLGRDPMLLKRLSEASGVQLITNTGYYAASQGKYLPAFFDQRSSEQIAHRWLAEWREGIDGTGVRPGFIKIGLDAGPLDETTTKLVRAAALAHLDSGLTIAAHSGDGQSALAQLDLLETLGVAANAWIWVHAQTERDIQFHRQAAERGAWIEFDGISETSIAQHVELVMYMKRIGCIDRVLLSHDAGWYSVGEPHGGTFRSYEWLFTKFLPALQNAGVTAAEIDQLTTTNPHKAFMTRVRRH